MGHPAPRPLKRDPKWKTALRYLALLVYAAWPVLVTFAAVWVWATWWAW